MTPEQLLQHHDQARLWGLPPGVVGGPDTAAAYQQALAVRQLRQQRGEVPRGYKIGFTNRTLWQRYEVFAPMWGTVWDTGLSFAEPAALGSAGGSIDLTHTCQPRLEPEIVFGMKATPVAHASWQQLFEAIDWIAPGFEVVQSHALDWKFTATDTMADSGLHARLLVGPRQAVQQLATDAQALHALLAQAQVTLFKNGQTVEQGTGANVLDSPLNALHHFLKELRQCPGAVDLQAGDVITTGTWTDAWPLQVGDNWRAEFSAPLGSLSAQMR
ncbi:hydratase [Limnohabitans sp. 2KL-1]|uniref:2-keto-4-pentenoate hydratase n=1 Tax=Limnohabitans sp. 2KL-1 TaxID=1100699 RepID=UPI000D3CF200|nr:fumarylacetoacetate hydrolase family protein [Limnohabitans sp. 2KL-1]PUE49014.1 hydratase [Limnohabitans sp. 2KL-1]